ncbi:methionine gamma-lyase [Klebsormidium nitens]|uniref:Methionine gamma-lyase n=1 Tax=Klebsormidium nitens TaxID=105231 RepID=A0A1Y1I6U9_KLENI|nr:methionine gamma-lyase [Klebsormidium nitens]|eukprot:GAQ84447.1 methionine gamma-lyase [Klebsormidium nitens]
MGAISASLLSHLRSGDLVIAQYNVYGGTLEFLEHDLPRYGVTVLFEDVSNLARVEEILIGAGRLDSAQTKTSLKETPKTSHSADVSSSNGDHNGAEKADVTADEVLSDRGSSREKPSFFDGGLSQNGKRPAVNKPCKVVIFAETVSNPLLVVTDIRALGELSKRAGAVLMVDHTFGTPLRSRPLTEGADLVIHSATKFLGGHHDLLAGAVVGSVELIRPIRDFVQRVGLWAAPFDAWMAVRGIRTLQVRMERAWANAAALGRRLEKDPRVTDVTWHEKVALVTFVVMGGIDAAEAATAALKLIIVATSRAEGSLGSGDVGGKLDDVSMGLPFRRQTCRAAYYVTHPPLLLRPGSLESREEE